MKTIRTWMPLVCCLSLAFVACGPVEDSSSTSDAGTNNNSQNNNTNNNNNNSGQYNPCSSTNRCPDGQWCFNGMCAPGCNSNGDCATDQYCDTADLGPPYFCKNKTVSTCPETPCAEGQVCRNGLCSAAEVPNTQCTPRMDGNDGCDKYAVCLDEDEDGPKAPACMSFPPCPESGVCPAGTTGAVCNDGYVPNKGRFCMTGLCKDAGNCPSEWKCVKQTSNAVLGFCSSGGPYEMCFSNADCTSNVCNLSAPGFPGMCQ